MIYLILFLIISVASYAYYKIADKLNIVDKPNHRSSHTKITIRGGGVIFYIALLLFFVLSGWEYPYFFISASLLAIVSFIDDLKPLPPSYRLPVQFIGVALVLFQLDLDINLLYYLPLLIVGVGFINAYNFMDGINGITGLYTIAVIVGLLCFNVFEFTFIANDILVLLLFSLVVFLFYNFRKKALFFAGDVGSITLAICVLFCVLKLFFATGSLSILLLVAVYGVDSVLTILRRIKMKEKITDAHRHHLYQKMVDSGKFTHLQTSCVYALIQFLLFGLFFSTYKLDIWFQLFSTIGVLMVLAILYFLAIKILSKNEIT